MKKESLVHIVCTRANYLSYHTCMHYPRNILEVSIMGVYKDTEIPKKCTGEAAGSKDMPGMLQRTLLQAIVYLVNH